ncbi:hypothetical protein HC752_12885 [Vibrio sp. S9_S30]|uniref:hypothetical protein n=1 Tax=Vibrio sp. S9_S30 TaxID=2720226 RepID=UPI001680D72E|nr:hypothetical protein [Vibrio sp. S9_S30]MBD1557829.1 hypothetical protein [Vibrio sp. S9_S30]
MCIGFDYGTENCSVASIENNDHGKIAIMVKDTTSRKDWSISPKMGTSWSLTLKEIKRKKPNRLFDWAIRGLG